MGLERTEFLMDRLLLVDGHCLLFQMFFGMPARIIGQNGKTISGTLGFVGALRRMLAMTDPTHVAVIFDSEGHNPRTELDAAYKADREDFRLVDEQDNPFSQLPDIYRALDLMHIAHAEAVECEADDVLAAYAVQYGAHTEMVIASQDSDLFQLINDRVTVLRYRGAQSLRCDKAYIQDKLGIAPWQYADYKSLTGDGSDNVKGVPGVGPKTAAALMAQFDSLDALLAHPEQIQRPKLRRDVTDNLDRIRLNRKLISLDGQAAIPFPIEQLGYTDCRMTTTQILRELGLR